MGLKKFSEELSSIFPYIHVGLIKSDPGVLIKKKLTFPQMVILDILRLKKECKMSDVAGILGVTKSAVTGMADKLIKEGAIKRKRSIKDRRIVRVSLTPKGLNLASQLAEHKLRVIKNLFIDITEKERIQYLNILRKLKKNIQIKAGLDLDV